MKETTIIAIIATLMVFLISIILGTFALDTPQPELFLNSEPPGEMDRGGLVVGHGEGNPVTNQNDTYVSCEKDVCAVTVIPWVTPNFTYTYSYAYSGGSGGQGDNATVHWVNYTPLAGGGGAAGSYSGIK